MRADSCRSSQCRRSPHDREGEIHINVVLVEAAVEAHYATIRFSAQFVADVRAHVAHVIAEHETAERLLHQQLTTELQALDTREENLVERAADATIPQPKIRTSSARSPASVDASPNV